ncbi:MAG: hypothetical protein WBW88_11860 [Rhodothermales bacterium]|jgi:hypothetical protein
MAKQTKSSLIVIQAGLAVVILVLAYFLYDAITSPWAAVEHQHALTAETRERMDDVRVALRRFEEANGRFPQTIDSLAQFVRTDSILASNPDSIFGATFNPDSFLYSARHPKMFEYSLNDTSRVKIYLLKDPDSDDHIGSAQPDITQLHAASWE